MLLEPISKMWIRVQGKARGGEKAQHTREYVSILRRPATPPWGLRPMFEMGSSFLRRPQALRGIFFIPLTASQNLIAKLFGQQPVEI